MTTYRHCRYGGWISIEGTPYRRAFLHNRPLQDTEWFVRQDCAWFSRSTRPGAALVERKDLPTAPYPGIPPENVHRAVWGPWIDVKGVAYRQAVRIPGTDPYDDVYVANYRNEWFLLADQDDVKTVTPTATPSWAPYELPGHPTLGTVLPDPQVLYGATFERDGEIYAEYTVADKTVYLVRSDLETYRVNRDGKLERCIVPDYLRSAFRNDGMMPRFGKVQKDGRLLYRKAYEVKGAPEAPGWFLDAFGAWYESADGTWAARTSCAAPFWAVWLPVWIPFDLEDDGPDYGPWFRRGRQEYRAAVPHGTLFDGKKRTLQDATGRYHMQQKKDGVWSNPKALNVPPDWCPGPHRVDPDAPLDAVFDKSVAALAKTVTSPFLEQLASKDDPYPTVYRVPFLDHTGVDRDVDVASASTVYELTEDDTLTILERGGTLKDSPEHLTRFEEHARRLAVATERAVVASLLDARAQYGLDAPTAEQIQPTAAGVLNVLSVYDAAWKGSTSAVKVLLVNGAFYEALCVADAEGVTVLKTLEEKAPTLKVLATTALDETKYAGLVTVSDKKTLELVYTCRPVNLYRGADPYTGTHTYLLFQACAPCSKSPWAVLPVTLAP